jgi:S-sulfo-L-cysteine synthase (O-acetyl-L-serine-dependent)
MLRTLERSDLYFRPAAIGSGLDDLVGSTPLLGLRGAAARAGLPETVELYAKAEWYNPSGSIKDRAALNIVRTAESAGQLGPGRTLLDATSGNMGIAYAMFGSAHGFRVRLALPANASRERVTILRAYGAELVLTDPLEGSDGAIAEARRLAAEGDPDVFYADQYNNPANWQAHYLTTAEEIWQQTAGQVTHFVAGLGTSGTFMGTTRRLREIDPRICCVSMQPDGPYHGLEGLKHMPSALVPGIYQAGEADRDIAVRTEDAYTMAHELARCDGLLVGISGAANVVAAIQVARELPAGVVVTVLPDSAFKYLSEHLWDA